MADADGALAQVTKSLAALTPETGADAPAFKPDVTFLAATQRLRDALADPGPAKETTVAAARTLLARADALASDALASETAYRDFAQATTPEAVLAAAGEIAALKDDSAGTRAAKVVAGTAALWKKPAEAPLPPETAAMLRATATETGRRFIAADPTPTEISTAGKLAAASRFSGAWSATKVSYLNGGGTIESPVYLKDRPTSETFVLNGGSELQTEAEVLRPDGTSAKITFKKRMFDGRPAVGDALESAGPSGEGELLAAVARLYDSDRAVFTEAPVALLDRVFATPASPLLKAWIHQEMLQLVEERPEAWGEVFSPEMKRDGERLRAILGAPIDFGGWLTPDGTATCVRNWRRSTRGNAPHTCPRRNSATGSSPRWCPPAPRTREKSTRPASSFR